MEYPLLLQGELKGALKVDKEGLYTRMEAWAPDCDGMVRLWVQGEGREAYLGLMEPVKDGLHISRRLSRLELKDFPEKIQQASDCRLKDKVDITYAGPDSAQAAAGKEEAGSGEETATGENGQEAEQKEPDMGQGGGGNRDGPETGGDTCSGVFRPIEEKTEKAGKDIIPDLGRDEGIIWRERRDGSLVARDGEGGLLALPAKLRHCPEGIRLRKICGRDYLIFRY